VIGSSKFRMHGFISSGEVVFILYEMQGSEASLESK
jgi:hypothetical protein